MDRKIPVFTAARAAASDQANRVGTGRPGACLTRDTRLSASFEGQSAIAVHAVCRMDPKLALVRRRSAVRTTGSAVVRSSLILED